MADWNALYSNQGIKLTGNPALQELQSGIAQQRKQQALDNKEYAAQVAKLNFGGAKDADLDYLHKQYGGILDTFSQIRATNNPRQRAELSQKMQQQQNEFLYNIEKSKQANKQDLELADIPLNPTANAALEPDATQRILGLTRVSTFDPSRETMYRDTVANLYAPKAVDWNKETLGILKGLVDKTTTQGITKEPVTGMLVNKKTVSQSVDKNAYMQGVLNKLKDPQVLRAAKRDFGGDSPESVAKAIVDATYDNYAKTLGTDVTTGQPFETPAQRDARMLSRQKEFALWKESNIGEGRTSAPSQQTIPYLNGKAMVTVPDYVPLSIPKKNFAGSPAYSLTDGSRVNSLESSGDYSIVGVGSFPFIKSGNKKGEIAQPNFAKTNPNAVEYMPMVHIKSPQTGDTEAQDYVIDFAKMPENIKNSKAIKSAIGGFGDKKAPAAKSQAQGYNNITTAKDPKGNVITIGYKNGKWFDTKTNKPVE